MPCQIDKNGLMVLLGYGDIGIGYAETGEWKGIAFEPLSKAYKAGEEIPEEDINKEGAPKVFVGVANERGVVQLRQILREVEKKFGIEEKFTLGMKTIESLMSQIGDLKARIQELEHELKQKNR